MTVFGIAAGAAVGAAVRSHMSAVGWHGTLVVNLVGSFVLGLVAGIDPADAWGQTIGAGFCGALTTYATFAFEASAGRWRRRATIIVCNVVGCVVAASVGYAIGAA